MHAAGFLKEGKLFVFGRRVNEGFTGSTQVDSTLHVGMCEERYRHFAEIRGYID